MRVFFTALLTVVAQPVGAQLLHLYYDKCDRLSDSARSFYFILRDPLSTEPKGILTVVILGGIAAFYSSISKKLNYKKVEGKTFVSFSVNEDGSLSDIKIAKGTTPESDAEVLWVMRYSPKWNAGHERGVPLKETMVLPIMFHMQ